MLRATTDYLLDLAEKLANPTTAARARVALGSRSYFDPFGGPMNGQTARLETTRQIIHDCAIAQIIETGTFRGTTTEWLAGFGIPVTTIESYPPNYHFSRVRLKRKPNVTVELGSSATVLPELARRLDRSAPTLFYLDAHWEEYLPLADELRLILAEFAAPVVLIDDFEVPGEPGYEYDDYGPGKALRMEYLAGCLPAAGPKLFHPTTPALQETGRRRGWIVLTPNAEMAAILARCPLLRESAGTAAYAG